MIHRFLIPPGHIFRNAMIETTGLPRVRGKTSESKSPTPGRRSAAQSLQSATLVVTLKSNMKKIYAIALVVLAWATVAKAGDYYLTGDESPELQRQVREFQQQSTEWRIQALEREADERRCEAMAKFVPATARLSEEELERIEDEAAQREMRARLVAEYREKEKAAKLLGWDWPK